MQKFVFLFLFSFFSLPTFAADSSSPASARILNLHERVARELVGNMDNQVRRARFRSLLREAFDLDKVTQFVMGSNWRRANEKQRANFKRVFEDYLVKSYADSFKSYGGTDFKITRVANTPQTGVALVTTLVKMPKKDGSSSAPAEIEWRLRGLKIVDVSVENVSLSMTKRSEISEELQRNGNNIDALIQKLAQKSA